MKNKFIEEICNCGCNKTYTKWLNPPEPAKWKIISYTNITRKPLVIKRLTDGVEFRLGDTILLNNALGTKKIEAKLYEIQVEQSGFMQLHAYPLYSNGSYSIRNEKHYLNSANDSTHFVLLKNITKI